MPSDERRRDLELAAYGQSASAEESAAARRELEQLAGRRARAEAEAAREAVPSEVEAPTSVELDEGGQDPAPSSPTPRRPRRSLFIAAVAGALVVGLAGGALLEAVVNPSTTTVVSPPAADLTPTPGSDAFDGDPSVVASSREKILAAEALLARAAKPSDVYPASPAVNTTYVPSSTRLEATTPSNTRVWIAREAGDQGGYCLLSLDPSSGPNTGLGLASCALPGEFVTSGILLSANGYDVTWKGGRIDVAIGN